MREAPLVVEHIAMGNGRRAGGQLAGTAFRNGTQVPKPPRCIVDVPRNFEDGFRFYAALDLLQGL